MQKTYYANQTVLATNNFPFSIHPAKKEITYGIVAVKKATAIANGKVGNISDDISRAIVTACDEILAGKFDDQFVTPALQGGAGTSINMNVNEVIATRATEILAGKGKTLEVHPNDHVNRSQSTNDANPSGLKLATIKLLKRLIESVEAGEKTFDQKALEFADVAKLGRTHLQDAVPTTLGEEFASYAAIMRRHKKHLEEALPYMYDLNLGGTAIGSSANASPEYVDAVYKALKETTKLPVRRAENFMSQTGSQSDFVLISQAVTLLTLDLSKIASDLRMMASGPNGGLGEISLLGLQPGSSIMPGKVNPILPESINQLYYLVSGNNLTIEHAAHAAQFELGVMGPILADSLMTSLELASEVIDNFMKKCVIEIKANRERCREHLEKSTAYATLLTPTLGYDAVSKAVKLAIAEKKTIRQVIVESNLLSDMEFDRLTSPTSNQIAVSVAR